MTGEPARGGPALLGSYARAPVTFVRGSGCYVYDDQGREYLDFVAGIAVCALGHAHPAIAEAVSEQVRTLVHVSNLYHHQPAGLLAEELVRRCGLSKAFFCNSGAEANEAAIKLARKLAYRRGEKDRTTILACAGSFHGRTLGALSATANDAYKEGFGPLPEGFAFTPFNDIAALERNMSETVAAFIVEPIQGESGVHVADRAFLEAARRLCDERGALLIFDEVQCGLGRVGPLFAFQAFDVTPDVITLAKALANGLPIGAMLVAEGAIDGLQAGDHGSTFGGSPVPCAAALAHLRVRDEQRLEERSAERSDYLFGLLRELAATFPSVLEAPRGLGLLVGIPMRDPYRVADVVAEMRDRGMLVGSAGGNTLRLAPPLIVTNAQIDAFAVALAASVSGMLTRSPDH